MKDFALCDTIEMHNNRFGGIEFTAKIGDTICEFCANQKGIAFFLDDGRKIYIKTTTYFRVIVTRAMIVEFFDNEKRCAEIVDSVKQIFAKKQTKGGSAIFNVYKKGKQFFWTTATGDKNLICQWRTNTQGNRVFLTPDIQMGIGVGEFQLIDGKKFSLAGESVQTATAKIADFVKNWMYQKTTNI